MAMQFFMKWSIQLSRDQEHFCKSHNQQASQLHQVTILKAGLKVAQN